MTADDFPRMDARTASHGREGEDGDAHGCASPQSSPERDRSDAVLGHSSVAAGEQSAVADLPSEVRYLLRGKQPRLFIHREVKDPHLNVWTPSERYGPFEDRAAARQHMIDTTDERTARDA